MRLLSAGGIGKAGRTPSSILLVAHPIVPTAVQAAATAFDLLIPVNVRCFAHYKAPDVPSGTTHGHRLRRYCRA